MDLPSVMRRLRIWLRDNQANYVEHHSWLGDTEGGFYSEDRFDIDKLMGEIDNFEQTLKEMDEFGEKLKAEKRK